MKYLAIAAAAASIFAAAAPAVAQDVRIGPGGVTVSPDRGPSWREREEWRERRAERRADRWRRDREIDRTGSVRCRMVTVRSERPNGDVVVRRSRQCD